MSMSASLEESLAALEGKQDVDKAAIELCRIYARAIDAVDDNPKILAELGTKLQSLLTELLMTPKARHAVSKGGTTHDLDNPLARARAERAKRAAG